MCVGVSCFGLFVDISDTVYCSMYSRHQVVKRWLNDNTNVSTTVAGNGTAGSLSNQLVLPVGIFVDTNFDLYVADNGNNRIQLFKLGQLNGITVAGTGSLNTTITLRYPTAVVLDADKYLFIVDKQNNRIIGSDSKGFRCIVGCSGSGAASNQLTTPEMLWFDSYGNLFVADRGNNRIQKFFLYTNSCGKSETT